MDRGVVKPERDRTELIFLAVAIFVAVGVSDEISHVWWAQFLWVIVIGLAIMLLLTSVRRVLKRRG
ncbi:MAG TPA: hypothetical protein VLK34_05800 [Nocardioidaceae bacterium]|nr:hypothetical protein [Nocardioidaceae bacterium]